ncbi:hypothetical protein [Streptomyces sp. NPDC003688]
MLPLEAVAHAVPALPKDSEQVERAVARPVRTGARPDERSFPLTGR